MKDYAPPMNAIMAQVTGEAKYPEQHENKRYMILYDEDYHEHGIDMAGNVALLLDEDRAREVKRLAEEIIEDLEDNE